MNTEKSIELAVMAGGSGSRLWPLSREAHPKQLLALSNDKSMLNNTLNRFNSLNVSRHTVLCHERYRFEVAQEIMSMGLDSTQIILEPCARDTAAATVLAALSARDRDPEAVVLLCPADHAFKSLGDLEEKIIQAITSAEEGYIVAFGITPTQPATGYGYIKMSDRNQTTSNIKEFVEKPSLERAQQYIKSGDYLWNSGMLLFKAQSLLDELVNYEPDLVTQCEQAFYNKQPDLDFIRIAQEDFEPIHPISIDYALMEKTNKAVVIPIACEWSDLGSWEAVWDYNKKDENSNVLQGDISAVDTKNCYIRSIEGFFVATIGINNLSVVVTPDALLISELNAAQKVKNIVSELKKNKRQEYLVHQEMYRPWGKYKNVVSGARYQVKLITVKPGEKLSVQKHFYRAEHWIVVSGVAVVYQGESVQSLKRKTLHENESVYIAVEEVHSLENPGVCDLKLIEVQTGSYLGEDDIVRLDDKYGR
jgi:mannose-1-phosphate guanylyltransferase/mannose-6-phosphate isomerase